MTPALDRIMAVVERAAGASRDDLLGPSRRQPLATYRHIAFFLGRTQYGATVSALGRAFGRDRATVLHGVRRVAARCEVSSRFAAVVRAMAAEVGAA